MFCAISGEAPKDPVVNVKTGHLYERRVIEKIIKDTNKCPFTGVRITTDDLIAIHGNTSISPRAISNSSIPAMLSSFQNEWDEVMSEVFTLRQHLEATRQELSQALYQHDAACRVIARLMIERDEARDYITTHLKITGGNITEQSKASTTSTIGGNTAAMEISQNKEESVEEEEETNEFLKAAVTVFLDTSTLLSGGRRGRVIPPTLATSQMINAFTETKVFQPHKDTKTSGITCMKLDAGRSGLVLTGGVDKDCILSDLTTSKIVTKFTGHKKKVNDVAFHPQYATSSLVFTASADGSMKVWKASEKSTKSSIVWNYTGHSGEVSGVSVHPSGLYSMSFSLNGSWALLDIENQVELKSFSTDSSFVCGSFHPDGLLFGFGSADSAVQVWDVRIQRKEIHLAGEHQGGIAALQFSENGYFLAAGDNSGAVKLWDLRKQKAVKTMQLPSEGDGVTSLAFDHTGTYLAVGSGTGSVNVKVVKDWSDSGAFPTVQSLATTGIAWGVDASSLVTSSLDKTIKVLSSAD